MFWRNFMHLRRLKVTVLLALLVLLASCATPFQPPTVVKDSSDFPGLVKLLNESNGQPIDVVLVHGMCTTTASWPISVMLNIASAVGANASVPSAEVEVAKAMPNEIQLVPGQAQTAAGTIRFSGLVWSPLVKDLKSQLLYDMTGKETDCKISDECRPRRAVVNGTFKDSLLNDCLADALAYQGIGKQAFREAMVNSLTQVVQRASDSSGPIVVVSASLGSKMVFDALSEMLLAPKDDAQRLAANAIQNRLAVVFMAANQLPILGLADQDLLSNKSTFTTDKFSGDSLKRFLNARQEYAKKSVRIAGGSFTKLAVVAFTDPNDLLSYRLLPSRYKSQNVDVADILVSNQQTYFGVLENPLSAHTTYLDNKDVARFIACGNPESSRCK
jgi:hypothetical protein